jgi:hypothetical protein
MTEKSPDSKDSVDEWRARKRYNRDPNVAQETLISEFFIDPKHIPQSLQDDVRREQFDRERREAHDWGDDEFSAS